MEQSSENLISITGFRDLDREVLLNLEDKDLLNTCQSSKYLYSICNDDFWIDKLNRISTILRRDKPESLTWKQWYFFWSKHSYGLKLVYTLGLQPSQVYISLSSVGNKLVNGAEAFQTIDLTLRKAIEIGDNDLINYFWNAYLIISGKYRRDLREQGIDPDPLLDHVALVELAYERGFEDIALQFIRNYNREGLRETSGMLTDDYHEFSRILGKYKGEFSVETLKAIFKSFFPDHLIRDEELTLAYVIGLIEGFHNKEAKEKYKNSNENDQMQFFEKLLIAAASNRNQEMIDFLREDLENDEEVDGIIDLVHQRENLRLKDKEEKKKKQPSTIKELEEFLKSGKRFTLDVKTAPLNLLLYNLNIDDSWAADNITRTTSRALFNGRYDFILSLNFNEKIFNERFWGIMLSRLSATQYKDLALYLLIQCSKYQPDIYSDFLQDENIEGKYEIIKIIEALNEIDINDLDDEDFYTLLISPYQD